MRNLNQLTTAVNKAINAVNESTEKNSRVIATAINDGFVLIEKNPEGEYATGIDWASAEFDYSKQTCYKMRSAAINFLSDTVINDNLRFLSSIFFSFIIFNITSHIHNADINSSKTFLMYQDRHSKNIEVNNSVTLSYVISKLLIPTPRRQWIDVNA